MVDADYDDTTRDHTLSGTLGINDFRISRAPVLGKLLQAVTLYGLVDALGGPGLSFSRLTAPFQFNDQALILRDARAFSPSLGLTAKGRIDRTGNRLDLEGTLVVRLLDPSGAPVRPYALSALFEGPDVSTLDAVEFWQRKDGALAVWLERLDRNAGVITRRHLACTGHECLLRPR